MNLQETEQFMANLAGALHDLVREDFGDHVGFALLIFDFEDPGLGNYVSNARRDDMIQALRMTADRLERNEDIPPAKGEG